MTALLLAHLRGLIAQVAAHRTARRDDGVTAEYVVVTALLVILAIAVVGVISAKILARANSIDLGGGG